MSLVCPYCQSRDTVLLESPQHLVINSHSPSAQNNVMSPLALATLGISVSKSLNIPPDCRRLSRCPDRWYLDAGDGG